MPKIAEDTATAQVDILAQDAVPHITEVGNGRAIADDATLDLHGVADPAAVPHDAEPPQVGIRADDAPAADAHIPLDNRTRLDDGTLAQGQHPIDRSERVNRTTHAGLHGLKLGGQRLQSGPRWRGLIHVRRCGAPNKPG